MTEQSLLLFESSFFFFPCLKLEPAGTREHFWMFWPGFRFCLAKLLLMAHVFVFFGSFIKPVLCCGSCATARLAGSLYRWDYSTQHCNLSLEESHVFEVDSHNNAANGYEVRSSHVVVPHAC